MKRLLGIWGAVLLTACSASADAPVFPYFEEDGGRVRDGANVLSSEVEQELALALDRAETIFGPQMAVVTVDSLHGYTIEDFSLYYARAWGLGDKGRDDGLLLLVAPNERRVRIEVGTGLERTFDDLFCKDVLDDAVLPQFREGDIEAGIVAGAEALMKRMQQHPTIPANDNASVSTREAA